MSLERYKRAAAEHALRLVNPGMKLGLGTGSTAKHFVELLAASAEVGLDVVCVPTSETTEAQARALGLRVSSLDEEPFLDLTIDGADEIDPELRLIKGGGGALLREKIVATASERMVVIADQSKKVERLGRFPLPVEVVPFGLASTRNMISVLAADCGCRGDIRLRLRADGSPFLTDGGHLILDCAFGSIEDADTLAEMLKMVPGVVEHGLFLGLADIAIIAGPDGVETIEPDSETTEA
jgi:ribose 5-phosphate isomerase A